MNQQAVCICIIVRTNNKSALRAVLVTRLLTRADGYRLTDCITSAGVVTTRSAFIGPVKISEWLGSYH